MKFNVLHLLKNLVEINVEHIRVRNIIPCIDFHLDFYLDSRGILLGVVNLIKWFWVLSMI